MDLEIRNRIIRYLNNDMNELEREGLENDLDNNEDIANVFFEFVSNVKVKHDLDMLVKQNSPNDGVAQKKYKKRKLGMYVSVAAAVAVVLMSSVFFLKNIVFNKNSLIDAEYMSYPGNTSRSNIDNPNKIEGKAFSLYQNKNFFEAAELFGKMSDTAIYDNQYNLYAGICLIWTGKQINLEEAKSRLTKPELRESDYSIAAQWYYAIALYETGQKQKAKVIFEEFANNHSGFKKEEALEILGDHF